MTNPTDKADLEILFNALLAAKVNLDSALREACLLVVARASQPSEREKVLRRLLEWASHEGRAHCYDDLIDYCTQNGLTLDGGGNERTEGKR